MTKKQAIQKATWLSQVLGKRVCVVRYFYGYDAEVFSASIPEEEIIKEGEDGKDR